MLLSKTQHFKAIKKFLIYEDLEENKVYLLTLRTYSVDGSKFDAIKSKANLTTFDKFVIEELGCHINLIGSYLKVLIIDELPKDLNEAHTVIKSHLNYQTKHQIIFKILLTGIGQIFIVIVKIL